MIQCGGKRDIEMTVIDKNTVFDYGSRADSLELVVWITTSPAQTHSLTTLLR